MSSPSESADPGPSASASSSETSTAPGQAHEHGDAAPAEARHDPASGTGPSAEAHRKPPIRIGTQRYGAKPPPAVAKPVLPLPPASVTARPADTALAQDEPRADETAAVAPGGEQAEVERAEGVEAKGPAPAKPSGHKSRGREPRRDREIKTLNEPPHARKFPPPNTRGQLTPDLEIEFMAALGDQSLDEVIASAGTAAAVAEMEPESRHRGRVISIHRDNVFLEIGGVQQGVIPLKNFATPPEPGTIVDVVVGRINAAEGLYELILPGASIDVGDWSEVAEGMVVDARVTGHNKGGLECEVNRLRGFIPASQISMYRVEDLAQFVDQKFACVITEANPEKRNLVLSRRAMLEPRKGRRAEREPDGRA